MEPLTREQAIEKYPNLRRANLSYANLRRANLSYANLSDADLRYANLRYANLRYANLRYANLSGADLRYANLSGATGLLDPADFIAKNFSFEGGNLIAYKSFGVHYDSPEGWDISAGSVITEVVNPCRVSDCGCGVNVATLEWVERNAAGETWKVAIAPVDLVGAVVPYHTDGKFRVGRVTLIEVV